MKRKGLQLLAWLLLLGCQPGWTQINKKCGTIYEYYLELENEHNFYDVYVNIRSGEKTIPEERYTTTHQ